MGQELMALEGEGLPIQEGQQIIQAVLLEGRRRDEHCHEITEGCVPGLRLLVHRLEEDLLHHQRHLGREKKLSVAHSLRYVFWSGSGEGLLSSQDMEGDGGEGELVGASGGGAAIETLRRSVPCTAGPGGARTAEAL